MGATGSESVIFEGDSTKQFSFCANGGTSEINNLKDITLRGTWAGDGSVFYTNAKGEMLIHLPEGTIQTDTDNIDSGTIVFHAMSGTFDVEAKDIILKGVGNGVFAQTNGAADPSSITINASENFFVSSSGVGVGAANLSESTASPSSVIKVNAKNIEIVSPTSSAVAAYGQHWESHEDLANANLVTLTASEDITLTGKNAIRADNGVSSENMAGVTVAAKTINLNGNIVADTNAAISIGENSGFEKATIKGDIQATETVAVNVNLGTNGSLEGAVVHTVGNDSSTAHEGVTLNLGQNSTWKVTGTSNVGKVEGTGNLELTDRANTVNIGTAEGTFTASIDGVTADDFTDAKAEVSQIIQVGNLAENTTLTTRIAEGDVNGAIDIVSTAAGTDQKNYTNTKLDAFSSVNVVGLMQWRHEMNDLTKRMGELRDSSAGLGTWVRAYGSEMEYGAQNVKTRNTSIQVGADYDVGYGWKVGAAFSYTDSDSEMNNGSADGDMYGLALYGSWLHESGQFVDLIAKYTRMDNDFNIGNMSGSYDNNGYSLSAEYGWNLRFNDLAFVEPQVELTYGTITGDSLTASNGVKIEQDDVDSFIGRIGLRGGFLFPNNKGTIYAHVSVLHDFDGDTGFKAIKDTNTSYLTDDLGGTWYEFGIGANFNWTEATYTYVDLERTTSGEVNENWRWNIGVRHVF